MTGFATGFLRGWKAEGDRIEKRKMFEQELKARREEVLLNLAPKLASSRGASGGTSGGSSRSPDLLMQALSDYGVPDDDIARLAVGGAPVLEQTIAAIEKAGGPDMPLTPEVAEEVAKAVRFEVKKGGRVDIDEVLSGLNLSMEDLSPEVKTQLDAMLQVPDSVDVVIPYQRTRPVSLEDVGRGEDMINQRLSQQLAMRRAELEQRIASAGELEEGAGEKATQELMKVDRAISALENNNPILAINAIGDSTIILDALEGVLQNNPRLADANLGVWENYKIPQAAIRLLQQDPSLAPFFDETYGPGMSQRYLR